MPKINSIAGLCLLLSIITGAAIAAPNSAPQTQIVVQWLQTGGLADLATMNRAQSILDQQSADAYVVDGNDFGSGTINIFLYASDKDIDKAVNRVVSLYTAHQLPTGMRIGVAVYKNNARTDWTFRAVFPAGFTRFGLTYDKNGDPIS